MNNQVCENHEKCPIFSGALKGKEMTGQSYRKQFCEAGMDGKNKCKRYMVKQKVGSCPPNLLPNSLKSVEQIINEFSI